MKNHPLNDILRTSLENASFVVDANKVIGTPIQLPDGTIAIPISKVVFGYGVGGSEFKQKNIKNVNVDVETGQEIFPFGGGSGGGITMTPTALVIIKEDKVKIISIEKDNAFVDKIFDVIKDMFEK